MYAQRDQTIVLYPGASDRDIRRSAGCYLVYGTQDTKVAHKLMGRTFVWCPETVLCVSRVERVVLHIHRSAIDLYTQSLTPISSGVTAHPTDLMGSVIDLVGAVRCVINGCP